jgi:hypothetical protein
MLARRLPRQVGASVRALSTTASAQSQATARSPALGDITPTGGPEFEKKQTEFRERIVAQQEAKRRKEQEESMYAPEHSPDPFEPCQLPYLSTMTTSELLLT